MTKFKTKIKTNYDRNHYYFHRTDPTPWIAIDEPPKFSYAKLFTWILNVLSVILLLYLFSHR